MYKFLIIGSLSISLSVSLLGNCIKGNCFDGVGILTTSSNATYYGEFANGKLQGKGSIRFANGDTYEGSFSNSMMQGNGIFKYRSGHVYQGGMEKNKKHGIGKMLFANGDSYEGQWISDLMHGKGTYQFSDGSYFVGELVSNKFHGMGTMYSASGKRQGLWQNNRLVKQGNYSLATTTSKPTNYTIKQKPEPEPNYKTNSTLGNYKKSGDGTTKIYALIVGVAKYKTMESLNYTDDDAYRVYAFYKGIEGGALPDDQISILIDEAATNSNIKAELAKMAEKVDGDDALVVYMSGHGLTNYFVPSDFDGRNNALAYQELTSMLDQSYAKNKILIMDACHTGSALTARSAFDAPLKNYYQKLNESQAGTVMFSSSRTDEVSLESSGLRQGIFSYYLLKGLKGAANLNGDQIVTVEEIYKYVTDQVSKYSGGRQKPLLAGDINLQFPMALLRTN